MSYSDCVARISTLDSLMRRVDPAWATGGYSMMNIPGLINSASPFAGILQTTADETAGAMGAATATASANALTANPNGGVSVLGPNASGVYTKFDVIGRDTGSDHVFTSPLPGGRLTQKFGPSSETLEPSATVNGVTYEHYHNGIDLAASLGTSVRAAADGTVTFAGTQADGAVVVKIRHDNGYTTLYGHLDPSLKVSVGDRVSQGQIVGKVGMTGNTTGPHLHFSLQAASGAWVDPQKWLDGASVPDPDTLYGPSAANPGELTAVSGAEVLARYDAVSSQIPYAAEIRSAAVKANIDPFLLVGLVYAESNFHPNAVSRCGAQGLTQLMPGTAKSLGVTDSFDVQQNLDAGAFYISRQMNRFQRVDLALAAYNAGPNAIARLGVVPDSKAGYVRKILNKWSTYQEQAA